MAPVVANLQQKCSGKVKFVYLNTDSSASVEMMRKYGVNAIPRFVFLDSSGNVAGDWLGSGPSNWFDPVRAKCQ